MKPLLAFVVTPALLEPLARLLAGGSMTADELDSINALLSETPTPSAKEGTKNAASK